VQGIPTTMSATVNQLTVREHRFSAPSLRDHTWQTYDLRGCSPGPRLCVMAGVHVNEVSSIAAAMQLVDTLRAAPLCGEVSIMPVVNLPALPLRSQHICPIDQQNINFSFPGTPTGSFSEALADAILHEWSQNADCLIDLHGGDLCETVARFTVAATIGDRRFDDFNLALARAFDPDIIVQLPPEASSAPGRSCSGRAGLRRHAAFAECGSNGLLDDASVAFHVAGVLRVAHLLGISATAPPPSGREPALVQTYHWVTADVAGWCRYMTEPCARVSRGQPIAEVLDYGGTVLSRIPAPDDGIVLWRCTHPVVSAGSDLFGIGA
jgi:predicted deacylase